MPITAWTAPVRTGADGAELRARFERLRERLAHKYGVDRRDERLGVNAPWVDPHDWMIELSRNERSLAAVWDDQRQFKDLVQSVRLSAHALNATHGRLRLGYEFGNTAACTEWVRRVRDRGL